MISKNNFSKLVIKISILYSYVYIPENIILILETNTFNIYQFKDFILPCILLILLYYNLIYKLKIMFVDLSVRSLTSKSSLKHGHNFKSYN